jgi:multiple sugar transport system ATP-binding protein
MVYHGIAVEKASRRRGAAGYIEGEEYHPVMAQVRLRNLTKRFKEVTAVDNMTLDIADKEFLVFVGPSGCGKTTALRMVAGLEEISGGEIWIDDVKVNDVPPKDRDIAMVFQNYALYPHMSVFENMAFGLQLRKVPKAEIQARVEKAAEMLGLSDLLKRKPKQLSGGQRQRVALARAIVRQPKVFLMDEPLSNLDAKLRVHTRAELIRLHRDLGITTIYVTHDQVEAMTMGNRIVVMNKGVVQQVDTPLHLYHHPVNKFVAGFIGSPAMNFLPATLAEKAGAILVDLGDFQLTLPPAYAQQVAGLVGKAVTFGIRPEDIFDRAIAPPQLAAVTDLATVQVDVTEPLGANVFAYLKTAKHEFIAALDADTSARAGGDLNIVVDMARAHLFDPETEDALLKPVPTADAPVTA